MIRIRFLKAGKLNPNSKDYQPVKVSGCAFLTFIQGAQPERAIEYIIAIIRNFFCIKHPLGYDGLPSYKQTINFSRAIFSLLCTSQRIII